MANSTHISNYPSISLRHLWPDNFKSENSTHISNYLSISLDICGLWILRWRIEHKYQTLHFNILYVCGLIILIWPIWHKYWTIQINILRHLWSVNLQMRNWTPISYHTFPNYLASMACDLCNSQLIISITAMVWNYFLSVCLWTWTLDLGMMSRLLYHCAIATCQLSFTW